MTNPYKLLQLALALFGVVALLLYPLAVVWPSGWAWHAGAPYESQYFMMIVGLYITIGVFLLNAARKPEANLSFIWFVVWSSAVHAVIMAVQSFSGGHHITWGICGATCLRCFWWQSCCRCSSGPQASSSLPTPGEQNADYPTTQIASAAGLPKSTVVPGSFSLASADLIATEIMPAKSRRASTINRESRVMPTLSK